MDNNKQLNDVEANAQNVEPKQNKVKNWFVKLGQKIREPFQKEQNIMDTPELKEIMAKLPPEMMSGATLTKGEKFKRFLKSQQGWLFVLPAVILMCIFTIYPIISAFVGAFMQEWNPISEYTPYNGWGFENFVSVLKGDTGTGGATFLQCLVNSFVLTVISVPLSTLLALLIAVALNSIKPLQKAYQTVLFLPYLTNSLAMGAVFATFFNVIGTPRNLESVGLFNNFLGLFGVEPIDWIRNRSYEYLNDIELVWKISDSLSIPWARYFVVIIYEVWSGLPFKILILFSALQSVNKQYYDAAKVDGASKSTVLWKITTPMISPMISYLLITGIMGGMKQYTVEVGIFGKDNLNSYKINTVVGYIYQYIYNQEIGYACAGSLLLFIIIMVITAINRRISKNRVTY